MTKLEWAALAKILATFYPHNFKPADKDAMTIWFQGLCDLEGSRVEAAVWSLVRTKSAFPSLADIRRLAEGKAEPAAEAWAELMRLIREEGTDPAHRTYVPKGDLVIVDGRVKRLDGETGSQETLTIQDPVLARVVASLGGLHVIGADTSNARIDTFRAQFLKLYTAFADEAKRQATFQALGVPSTPSTRIEVTTSEPTRLGAAMPQLSLPAPSEKEPTP